MVLNICFWNGRRGRGGKDAGCLEDRETKTCQKEVENEGQKRQTQIDGASGSTQVQFYHAGEREERNRERETFKIPDNPSNLIMMKHFLIIAIHLHTHPGVDKIK